MARKTFKPDGPSAEDRMLELFTNEMIAKLESLKSSTKWEKPWFSAAGMAWPKNMSGREYNGQNAILLKIMAEKNNYELPIWATFHRLTSLNYQKDPTKGPIPLRDDDGQDLPRVTVNKGEKSTPIGLTVFTVIHKDTKEKIPYEEYRELDAEEQKQYNVYPKTAVYNVFNVCQTNLKEARPEVWAKLAEFSRMPEQSRDENGRFVIPEVEAMVQRQRFYCPINHVDNDACYYSISKDCVTMVPPEKFKSGEAYVNNLYHECSHALGAVGRLDRFTPERMRQPNFQANEELTAELSAALLCSRSNLEKSIKRDSIPYLKSWLDSLHESPSYIRNVMSDVKKTSAMLIGRLEEVKQELEAEKEQNKEKEQVLAPEQNVEQKGSQQAAEKQENEVKGEAKNEVKSDNGETKKEKEEMVSPILQAPAETETDTRNYDISTISENAKTAYLSTLSVKEDIFSGQQDKLPDPLANLLELSIGANILCVDGRARGLTGDALAELQTKYDNANSKYHDAMEQVFGDYKAQLQQDKTQVEKDNYLATLKDPNNIFSGDIALLPKPMAELYEKFREASTAHMMAEFAGNTQLAAELKPKAVDTYNAYQTGMNTYFMSEKKVENAVAEKTMQSPKQETPIEVKKEDNRPAIPWNWQSMKERQPDSLLIFRQENAYTMFNEDAKTSQIILGLTMQKAKGDIDMTSFPSNRLDVYLPKLLRSGVRVTICDELKQPVKEKQEMAKQQTVQNPLNKTLESKRIMGGDVPFGGVNVLAQNKEYSVVQLNATNKYRLVPNVTEGQIMRNWAEEYASQLKQPKGLVASRGFEFDNMDGVKDFEKKLAERSPIEKLMGPQRDYILSLSDKNDYMSGNFYQLKGKLGESYGRYQNAADYWDKIKNSKYLTLEAKQPYKEEMDNTLQFFKTDMAKFFAPVLAEQQQSTNEVIKSETTQQSAALSDRKDLTTERGRIEDFYQKYLHETVDIKEQNALYTLIQSTKDNRYVVIPNETDGQDMKDWQQRYRGEVSATRANYSPFDNGFTFEKREDAMAFVNSPRIAAAKDNAEKAMDTSLIPDKHYFVTQEINRYPDKTDKTFVVVEDKIRHTADVILPQGVHFLDNKSEPGMNRDRIERALKNEGVRNVEFFSVAGNYAFKLDDSYFAEKTVTVAKMKNWNMERLFDIEIDPKVTELAYKPKDQQLGKDAYSEDLLAGITRKDIPQPKELPHLMDLGTYEIPEWSLNYLVNGDATGLSNKEIKLVDKFIEENFPRGYVTDINWENRNEFNQYPAFGERNEHALTRRGEAPFLAIGTVEVNFRDAYLREGQIPPERYMGLGSTAIADYIKETADMKKDEFIMVGDKVMGSVDVITPKAARMNVGKISEAIRNSGNHLREVISTGEKDNTLFKEGDLYFSNKEVYSAKVENGKLVITDTLSQEKLSSLRAESPKLDDVFVFSRKNGDLAVSATYNGENLGSKVLSAEDKKIYRTIGVHSMEAFIEATASKLFANDVNKKVEQERKHSLKM